MQRVPERKHLIALVRLPQGARLQVVEPQERGHEQDRGETHRLGPVSGHPGAGVREGRITVPADLCRAWLFQDVAGRTYAWTCILLTYPTVPSRSGPPAPFGR